MSDMNVNDSTSVTPFYLQSTAFQALPQTIKDELMQSSSTLQLNIFFPVGTPILPSPNVQISDSAYFFTKTSGAATDFSRSLNAQSTADQKMRGLRNRAALEAGLLLADNMAAFELAQQAAINNSQNSANQLTSTMTTGAAATDEQENNIVAINAGNSNDRVQYNNLKTAKDTLISTLTALGVTVQSDGSYLIPQDKNTEATAALATYSSALDTFNSYMGNRLIAANTFNTQASVYNAFVASENITIQDQIDTNHLNGYVTSNNIQILLPSSGTIDTSIYNSQENFSYGTPSGNDTTINIPPLADYISTYANNGPPAVNSISYTSNAPTTAVLKEQIYNELYKSTIDALLVSMTAAMANYAFTQLRNQLTQITNIIPDPLLNAKSLTKKILPETVVQSNSPTQTPSAGGASTLSLQAIGLTNAHIQGILGKANLNQAIRNFQLDLNDPQSISSLVTQLQGLLVGQIGANSENALVPSLEAIGNNLASLPATSPVFGILFALSFVNRVIEAALPDGSIAEAVEAFVQANPALQGLTPEQKAQLTAALNLGQIQLAIKLLETNLGLDGLSAQLLLPLLPPQVGQTLLAEVQRQNQESEKALKEALTQNFINQGFARPEALFLAQTGVELSSRTLTPSSTSVSATSINNDLLQSSITASLILADKGTNVAAASRAAAEILNSLAEERAKPDQSLSTTAFRAQIENQLRQLGFKASVAIQVAQEAVIVPAVVNSFPVAPTLTSTTSTSTTPTSTSPTPPSTTPTSASPPVQLNQSSLIDFVQKQLYQLLVPQIGIELTKQITEAFAISLFGNPHPDSSDIATVKSPNSLINIVKQQIKTLTKEHNADNDKALAESFGDTIKNSTDLYSFLLRAMDPAFLYVYSANAGIMYSRPTSQQGVSQSYRQSIDINV